MACSSEANENDYHSHENNNEENHDHHDDHDDEHDHEHDHDKTNVIKFQLGLPLNECIDKDKLRVLNSLDNNVSKGVFKKWENRLDSKPFVQSIEYEDKEVDDDDNQEEDEYEHDSNTDDSDIDDTTYKTDKNEQEHLKRTMGILSCLF